MTYALAQTAGNLNVVAVGWNDTTSTVTSVTDSRGNSYTLAVGPTTGTGLRQSIYYAKNIVAGSNTVTVTFNQAAAFVDVRMLEYSGLDTSESAGCDGGGGGDRDSGEQRGGDDDVGERVDFWGGNDGGRVSAAAGTGFTLRIITIRTADIAEDKTVSSTGSYSATAHLQTSPRAWVMQMATFRASGQGTAAIRRRR